MRKSTMIGWVWMAVMVLPMMGWSDIVIRSGETVAFLGDSITRNGNSYPNGYIHLVLDGLKRAGVDVAYIPAGIGGNKSNDMLFRLEKDVLEKKPQWMTLSCGVNDVWHGERGVPLEAYKENITKIVDRTTEAGVKMILFTATMIGEDPTNENNQKLAAYNEFLRALSKERGIPLADLNKEMVAMVADPELPARNGNKLTGDGVHMNRVGDRMMARCILRTMGVPAVDVEAYDAIWQEFPNSTTLEVSFTLEEYRILEKQAQEAGVGSVAEYVDGLAKSIFTDK